ncbi:LysR family transcriptional regulator [Sneathiella chungangensis]|uniref:LysR family transcriptional regulator n=1 Tax=Sneathiella chungangensis TaxID=1418234 RepID=A0A845MID8_9PROT|nr:LysR substrate-binding domain-containing protein [Sneathiella chungangensis]MZR22754.1 LysR family transcriptional regulator [Sneathiella chungangensis]
MNKNSALVNKLAKSAAFLIAIKEEKSFAGAALRLSIDQSAISHRIRMLEDAIGLPLFERTTRKITLTETGKILCDAAESATLVWNAALEKIRTDRQSNQIKLTVPSSLAMKWLVPAISRMDEAGLDLSLDVNDSMVDLHAAEADVAIRFGPGPYPGFHVDHLAHCEFTPVAQTSFEIGADHNFWDLAEENLTLLSDRRGQHDGTGYSWDNYFQEIHAAKPNAARRHSFDRADLMLQAAMSGMGIALGRTLLIENDIAAGFLKVVGPPASTRSTYWLVTTASFAQSGKYQLLLSWLKEQIYSTAQYDATGAL